MSEMLKIDLTGKLALLTGASGQLGRVMARTLAGCGADLVLQYHNDHAGAERVEVRALGRQVRTVQADVGTRTGVQRIADVAHTLGDPDILVINAVAQIHPWSYVIEESIEGYES